MSIRLKRIYQAAADDDGYRVLVDGMWPRGIAKHDAALDEWCKQFAPSAELRRWFNHDRKRWAGFVESYRAELAERDPELIAALKKRAQDQRVTLLFAARDPEYNHAVVLKDYLEDPS